MTLKVCFASLLEFTTAFRAGNHGACLDFPSELLCDGVSS